MALIILNPNTLDKFIRQNGEECSIRNSTEAITYKRGCSLRSDDVVLSMWYLRFRVLPQQTMPRRPTLRCRPVHFLRTCIQSQTLLTSPLFSLQLFFLIKKPFLSHKIRKIPSMNQVATILGIQLPAMKARDAIQKEPALSSVSILPHQDSLLLLNLNKHKEMDDDDTVSTMLSSCSSLGLGVTFADPVVTEIHTRPYTTRLEKRALYYCERDYLEFKRDYFYGSTRDTLVKFTETVVSHVWTVPRHEEPSEMYYTEAELQR